MDGKLLNEARALRYLIDSLDDLKAAEALLDKKIYSQVMFHCQQVGEKASKACLSLWGIVLADEHKYADFLQKMVVPSMGKLKNDFGKLAVKISALENFYITARYGVDREGRIHLSEFEETDAVDAFNVAKHFLELCFKGAESKFGKPLPRSKEQLVLYLRNNYQDLIRDKKRSK